MQWTTWKRMALVALLLGFTKLVAAEPLQDFNGQARAIKEFAGQGKWLVVMIWASDCHVCNVEAEQYVQFHEQYKDRNARVLGISMDGQAKAADARAFIKRHHVTFNNLIGEPLAVAQWFVQLTGADWVGTPTFLIYNPQGELVIQQAGAVPVNLIEDYIKQHSKP
jgi:peroxiredoxin